MSWFAVSITFAVVWWLVLFMVLPFGVRTAEEAGEAVGSGHAPSAPVQPRLKLKAGITTVISAVIVGLIYTAVTLEWVDLRAYLDPHRS